MECGIPDRRPGVDGGRERFWAESRVVEFCAEHSEIVGFGQAH